LDSVPASIWAEQGRGADGFQRPLVPRSRFQPQLTPSVGRLLLIKVHQLWKAENHLLAERIAIKLPAKAEALSSLN
jgi:hypothetical protein